MKSNTYMHWFDKYISELLTLLESRVYSCKEIDISLFSYILIWLN